MNKKTIVSIAGVIAVLALIGVIAYHNSKSMSGSYTPDAAGAATTTLTFKGKTVTENDGGSVQKGTYEIADGELKMNFSDHNMTANLAQDKKSFTIKSTGNGLMDLFAKGIKFTKSQN
ncbi:hypothetical protein [Levilactobacillus bambusae]|uniref:Uncharacterized protein n=1 Tax=Levilactobacillus bambusae TaxID=2024736 RepID=A0A2V1N129_9LACO|nr:hypothetical protein [Levilactobacillus bambusae]PWG00020.1 hypothetical protein DCM90_03520 [Levilactobacillus bambusae]